MRKISFFLLIVLCLFPLQISSSQNNNDPFWNPDAEQLETWRVIEDVEEGAEITFWTWALSPNFDAYLEQVIANFEATYPEVTVNWEDHAWDQMHEDIRQSFADNQPADVINMSPSWIAEFAEIGLLTDMDAAISDYPELREQYSDGAWTTLNYDGSSYHVPWYLALSNFLGYNREILAELGLTEEDLPRTWEELYSFAEMIRSSSDYYALSLNFNSATELNVLQYLVYNDIPILDEEGNAIFNTPEAAEAFQLWIDLIENDLIPFESLTDDHRKMVERFGNRETVIIMVAPHMLRLVEESNPDVYNVLGIAPGITGSSGVNSMDVQSLVIPAETPYPKAALSLSLFVTNPEVQTAFSKEVGIFPSNLASYEDPFFTTEEEGNPISIIRPLAYDYVLTAENRVVSLPASEEIQQIIAIEQEAALLGTKTAQEALDAMITRINEYLAANR